MKEQYIGDVKDYYKYSIIEYFSKLYNKKVLFAWMLTPPDSKNEGNDISYLNNPSEYSGYNPILYKKLNNIVSENKSLPLIEKVLDNENYFFFSEELTLDIDDRRTYFNKLDEITINKKIYLVFFDPDKGIEVKSTPKGTKESNQYIYWDEIKHFWGKGRDMLIFQYIPRYTKHNEYINKIIEQCVSNLEIKHHNINIIKTNYVLFIYLRHEPAYNIPNNKILKLITNTEKTIIEFDELFCKFIDDQNNIYSYNIDISPYSEYGIGTQPINSFIDSDLFEIKVENINSMVINKKEEKALDDCNLARKDLIGKYFDKHGNIYLVIGDNNIIKFNIQIKYFSMYFNQEQEKRLKLCAYNDNKVLKLYNYGGGDGRWVLKDDKKTLEDGIGGFFVDYIDRKYGSILNNCKNNE